VHPNGGSAIPPLIAFDVDDRAVDGVHQRAAAHRAVHGGRDIESHDAKNRDATSPSLFLGPGEPSPPGRGASGLLTGDAKSGCCRREAEGLAGYFLHGV